MNGHGMFAGRHLHGIGHPGPHHRSFCPSCCHPVAKCCCDHREYRKMPKELLADAAKKDTQRYIPPSLANSIAASMKKSSSEEGEPSSVYMRMLHTFTQAFTASDAAKEGQKGQEVIQRLKIPYTLESAVIGGGCCVHLSVEYMPIPGADLFGKNAITKIPPVVIVGVIDSEGTVLAWGKYGFDDYRIKEGIMTTNPGARLGVLVVNAVAKVRWCEVFSC